MKSLFYLLVFILLATGSVVQAQIGLNGSAHPSAVLDVKSPGNDKAFYPPRLTTAQRRAIPNPQAGAFVYDLDKGTMYLHDGQNWLPLTPASDPNSLPPIGRTASDGGGYDYFGSSVAISGDYAVVGASTKTVGSNSVQGTAYIFVRSGNGWTEQQQFMANDGAGFDRFGSSVAIAGDYAVIGAHGKGINGNNSQGAAYVFKRVGSTWSQMQRLTADDGATYDEFGRSVAIVDNHVLVGAASKSVSNASGQGAVYVFVRSGNSWTQLQRLTANDGTTGDLFGGSVAASGDYAIVGASGKTINGNSGQGAAYIFVFQRGSGDIWITQQRLIAGDGSSDNKFGASVSLSNAFAVVGAPNKTVNATNQGAAYVYSRSGTVWAQQQQLTASDGAGQDKFGSSVAISGNYLMVGAPGKNFSPNFAQGAAYLLKLANGYWGQQRRFTEPLISYSQHGYSLGLSNGAFTIGSSFGVGKVYFGTVD